MATCGYLGRRPFDRTGIQRLLVALNRHDAISVLGSPWVVNVSSIGGKIAMATYGAYAGAKFAMEAVSDSLHREMAPFGVKVIIIEPGAVLTEMSRNGVATANRLATEMSSEQHTRYDDLIDAIPRSLKLTSRPDYPRALPHRLSPTRSPPGTLAPVTLSGAMPQFSLGVTRIVSGRLLDIILRRSLQPHYTRR